MCKMRNMIAKLGCLIGERKTLETYLGTGLPRRVPSGPFELVFALNGDLVLPEFCVDTVKAVPEALLTAGMVFMVEAILLDEKAKLALWNSRTVGTKHTALHRLVKSSGSHAWELERADDAQMRNLTTSIIDARRVIEDEDKNGVRWDDKKR